MSFRVPRIPKAKACKINGWTIHDVKEHKETEISIKSNDTKETARKVTYGKSYAYIQVNGRKIGHKREIKHDKIN
jgi:hypothetical protein